MSGEDIALVIVAKAPLAGRSKTRLCPPLSLDEAAALSECFIADVAASVADVAAAAGVRGAIVYTPTEAVAAFDPLLPAGFIRLAQRGETLGERLIHATGDLLAQGFIGVCLINADGPTLPIGLLHDAVAALRQPGERVVLAPAIDGGYCLIGFKRLYPSLFQGINWSTAQVLAQTLSRIARLQLPLSLLPLWYDVDDVASLQLLIDELSGLPAPLPGGNLQGSAAPRSRAYLQALRPTLEANGLDLVFS